MFSNENVLKGFLVGLIVFYVSAPIAWGEDLPAGNPDAPQRLANSPRHTEMVEVTTLSGAIVKALLALPQGSDPGAGCGGHSRQSRLDSLDSGPRRSVGRCRVCRHSPPIWPVVRVREVRVLKGWNPTLLRNSFTVWTWDEVVERINAVADYAMALPAAEKRFAVVGFCWGGRTTYAYAGERPDLAAGIVYYGGSPSAEVLARIKAPILGLYGEDDARVNVTIEPAALEMKRLGKTYQYEIYERAGHAFLESQQRLEGGQYGGNPKGLASNPPVPERTPQTGDVRWPINPMIWLLIKRSTT